MIKAGDRRIRWSVLLLGIVTLAFLASGAYGRANVGHITGGIYLVGGPASPTGKSACQGTKCPGRGRVIVRNVRGKVVARATVKLGKHFSFRLITGRYVVSGGAGCTTVHVRVAAGTTTTANVSCSIR